MFAPLPDTQVLWTDTRLRAGWLVVLLAFAVGIIFLPRSITNNDEFFYAGQAHILGQGRIIPKAGDPLMVPLDTPEQSFRYPLAWPAVLAPGGLISLRGLFVVALLTHLVGGAAVARMLVRRGASSALAIVYLFHPAFWLYSRTLLSDVPATVGLLVAMDTWENRSRVSTSLALGFTAAARLINGIVVIGFGLAILRQIRNRLGHVAAILIGVAVFCGIQLLVNRTLSGAWFLSNYAKQNALMVDGQMLGENAVLYLAGLALLPPFSLIFAFARPRRTDLWALVSIPVVALYIPVSFHNTSPNLIETLVGGQRYVLPAHAALLVATAGTWARSQLFRRRWVTVALGTAAAVVVCLAMMRLENRHRLAADAVAACKPDVLAFNRFANRVAGTVRARSYQAVEEPYKRTDADVLVIAPGMQSNQPGQNVDWRSSPPQIDGATCRQVGAYAIYDFKGRCPPHGEPCPR